MVAVQVLSPPQHLARATVETRRAVGAKVDPHAALFNDGRGGPITVQRITELRIGDLKHEHVVHDAPTLAIDTNCKELLAVLRRSGHPDLVVPDHWRRPGPAVNGRFPFDVL